MNTTQVYLVYDKECPLCQNYCQMARIQKSVGELVLVDARVDSPIMEEITRQGLDIDQGMVLKVKDVLYYGADAIHALALMSSKIGFFNRFNYWCFRSKVLSKIGYPILRSIRNLLLKFLGRTKINNLSSENNRVF